MLVASCPPEKRNAVRMSQFISDEIIPFVEKEQGFRGVWFFLDEAGGKFFSITLYETADDLQLSMKTIKELRSRVLNILGCSPVSMESLKVIAMKMK